MSHTPDRYSAPLGSRTVDNLSAIVAADRAFPAAVAEFVRRLGSIFRAVTSNTTMKTYLTLLMSLCLVLESHARLTRVWNYDTLNDKATLVVIATPTKVTETSEVAALPNIATVHTNGTQEAVMGKGIETSFDVLTVLKGERTAKTLILHHFTLVKPPAARGPVLVSFEPKDKKRFLMFLQKEADGRYVAVSGQTDPQDAIMEIVERYP